MAFTFVQTNFQMKLVYALVLFCFAATASAQNNPVLPAYKRFPTVPALQLLLSDSSKYTREDLPKKKPVLIMLFSPDCDHCQHEAEQMVAQKELLKDIQIVMVTTYPLEKLKAFAETYGLTQMDNVVMAKDPFYLLPSFYQMRMFPFMALYDKKGKLIATFEGNVAIDRVLAAFNERK